MKTIIKGTVFEPYLIYALFVAAFLSLSRLSLAAWLYQRVSDVEGWWTILLQGARVDLATICMALVIPILVSILIYGAGWSLRVWNRLVQSWLALLLFAIVFIELATPNFILEYNIRPNRLFIEYLIYPKEVFSMLLKSHLLELIVVTAVSLFASYQCWSLVGKIQAEIKPIKLSLKPIAFLLSFVVLAIGGRSTLGHRAINPSMVYFSSDPLVNSLILNSFYSTAYAFKQLLNEEKQLSLYGHVSEEQIIEAARDYKGIADSSIKNPAIPTLANERASFRGKPKNLVIILQESLGARFVGTLGGLPLTPNFDKLSQNGWLFDSLLATGTRSVRGIEAVVTGFTPTPDRAVVKLSKSQHDFFSIAELLSQKGYHTEFIYGGEAHFDNMKSFFLGNGFEQIIEEKDYINPTFSGSWGVSDEDLFNRADASFSQLSADGQRFFSLVFTSSNHSPFEYPEGRIKGYDRTYHTRNNAIQYADWALGKFFDMAKASNYWNDTVFLIIADHDANAHGAELVPPKSFHIPALILGNGIQSKRDHRVVSQLDMPPTLLSLIGIDNENPMLGRDLVRDDSAQAKAMMQYGQNFGFLSGNILTILQPHKKPIDYNFDHETFEITMKGESSKETAEKAIAIASWGKLAYNKHMYRLPKTNSQ